MATYYRYYSSFSVFPVRGCAPGSNCEVYKRLYSIESYRVYLRGVYLLVRERLHQVSERVVWAPLRPRTDAGLQSKTWRLLLDRDSIEELSKGRSARYSTPLRNALAVKNTK